MIVRLGLEMLYAICALVFLCSLCSLCRGGEQLRTSSNTSSQTIVHVVFSNHFDAGFALPPNAKNESEVGLLVNVMNRYFYEYIPRAMDTAAQARAAGTKYTWTMEGGAFLLNFYIHCFPDPHLLELGLKCPSSKQQQDVIQAMQRGDLAWHAFPFNGEPELMNEWMFASSINLARSLEIDFGVPFTTTMSQRDVPGLTRAVVPLLAKFGVHALSLGANGASAPIGVPKLSRWVDEESGADILLLYHPGGYGGITPADCVELAVPAESDDPQASGVVHVQCYAWKGDNAGPHTMEEFTAVMAQIASQYPGASVSTAILDDFTNIAWKYKDLIPVTPDGEMGDTWIHGSQADPLKTATARAVIRTIQQCLGIPNPPGTDSFSGFFSSSQPCESIDPDALRFVALYTSKAFEHTWMLDVKTYLHDNVNWTNAQFENAQVHSSNYHLVQTSIAEQRLFPWTLPSFELFGTNLQTSIEQAIKDATLASVPVLDSTYKKYAPSDLVDAPFVVGTMQLTFDPSNGGITSALERESGVSILKKGSTKSMGLVSYQNMNSDDFASFLNSYNYDPSSPWFPKDFGKPGLADSPANPSPMSVVNHGKLQSLWYSAEHGTVHLQVAFDASLVSLAGAPNAVWISYSACGSGNSSSPLGSYTGFAVTVQFFNKTSSRVPEAGWMTFGTTLSSSASDWKLNKIGSWISPATILTNGSHHLHAVADGGVAMTSLLSGSDCRSPATVPTVRGVQFVSLDAALVSVGMMSAFPTPLSSQPLDDEFHFSLHNNVWGTNYPQWTDENNLKYRFEARVFLA
eukprot:ANDGO_07529.mRNA.1 hypothetical protein CAOG_04643